MEAGLEGHDLAFVCIYILIRDRRMLATIATVMPISSDFGHATGRAGTGYASRCIYQERPW